MYKALAKYDTYTSDSHVSRFETFAVAHFLIYAYIKIQQIIFM